MKLNEKHLLFKVNFNSVEQLCPPLEFDKDIKGKDDYGGYARANECGEPNIQKSDIIC